MDQQYWPKLKMPSSFRLFVTEMWFKHKDEIFLWENKFPEYDDKYYFKKHKWTLKRMYKERH